MPLSGSLCCAVGGGDDRHGGSGNSSALAGRCKRVEILAHMWLWPSLTAKTSEERRKERRESTPAPFPSSFDKTTVRFSHNVACCPLHAGMHSHHTTRHDPHTPVTLGTANRLRALRSPRCRRRRQPRTSVTKSMCQNYSNNEQQQQQNIPSVPAIFRPPGYAVVFLPSYARLGTDPDDKPCPLAPNCCGIWPPCRLLSKTRVRPCGCHQTALVWPRGQVG